MEYSSTAGHDLMNNDVYVDAVCGDLVLQKIYANVDKFDRVKDFGAGVYGVTVSELLEKYPTAAKLRQFIGRKIISKDESLELYKALVKANEDRAYLL